MCHRGIKIAMRAAGYEEGLGNPERLRQDRNELGTHAVAARFELTDGSRGYTYDIRQILLRHPFQLPSLCEASGVEGRSDQGR
jgi:hypothetical protein